LHLFKFTTENRFTQDFEATSFLNQPRLLHVIPQSGWIYGITVLNEELFVARNDLKIDVYNTNNFSLTRKLVIAESKCCAIVACQYSQCLYITDNIRMVVHKYDPRFNNPICQFQVGEICLGLSLTKSHNLLATFSNSNRIREYSSDGSLIREISLDSSIDWPLHCVQLSNDQFVVSHSGAKLRRICIMDISGKITQFYGEPQVPSSREMHNIPCNIIVDKHDNVIFAHYLNDTVQLLSPSLAYLGYIKIPVHKLRAPHTLHLDEINHRLYIGDWKTGRLLVLTTEINGDN